MIVKHTDDVNKLLGWNGKTLLALLEDAETFYQKNCFGGLKFLAIAVSFYPEEKYKAFYVFVFFAFQVHELTAELEQLPRRAQVAAGFITYLSSAPEDVRKATMSQWCEAAGLHGFDFRRFMSTESEQLVWKAEGLPSDDLSMENALVILKVKRK